MTIFNEEHELGLFPKRLLFITCLSLSGVAIPETVADCASCLHL